MSIPDEALAPAKESVEREMRSRTYDRHAVNEEVFLEGVADIALAALESAAPIMLSHELEQTRLAHLDAVVNAQGLADAWESGMRHALAWLGLRHYGDVMAKDNPHKVAS